jgi:hypothetical protein
MAQPANPFSYQLRVDLHVPNGFGSELASKLAVEGITGELESVGAESERFLIHPRLGIQRQSIDASGEPVLRIGQLNSFLAKSDGNLAEFQRLIRLAEGQAWLDLFEPLRMMPEDVRLLPRAV